jgi:hypothetical protein
MSVSSTNKSSNPLLQIRPLQFWVQMMPYGLAAYCKPGDPAR